MKNVIQATMLVLVALVLTGCGIHTVDTGHRGIKVRFGVVEPDIQPEGFLFVNPFTTSVVQMDIRTMRFDSQEETYTKDIQTATIKYTLNYALRSDAVGTVYRTVGTDWGATLITHRVAQDIKDEIGKWDAVDLIANRQLASDHIQSAIIKHLSDVGIAASGFYMTDVSYSQAYDKAIENKVIAAQRAQEEQNKTVQVQQQANQTVIAAKAEAESMKIRADALAQNPKLVEYQAVLRWNGVLPVYNMGGATPFINLTPK